MQHLDDNKYLMVLCKDKPEDPIDYGYTLYFINNTEESIESLKIRPEYIVRDYDDEIEVVEVQEESYLLEPRSYKIINNIDEMDLPFNVCYDAYIKTKNAEFRNIFDIKHLSVLEMEIETVPILNKDGYVFAVN